MHAYRKSFPSTSWRYSQNSEAIVKSKILIIYKVRQLSLITACTKSYVMVPKYARKSRRRTRQKGSKSFRTEEIFNNVPIVRGITDVSIISTL